MSEHRWEDDSMHTLYRKTVCADESMKCEFGPHVMRIQDGKLIAIHMVPAEPEHQHQWLPWLTLPNGSSWTQCTGCGEQFQYDY